jgi:putative alpha-1,2-mannosidase
MVEANEVTKKMAQANLDSESDEDFEVVGQKEKR